MTPQERLAISRRALVNQLQGDQPQREPRSPRARRHGIAWVPVARTVATHWWRRHPANTAAQLAMPALERVAREHPIKLVAGAAGVGALVVLTRPWRLLSASAVVATLFTNSELAGVINTLMQRRSRAPKTPK